MVDIKSCKIDAPARESDAGAFPVMTESTRKSVRGALIMLLVILFSCMLTVSAHAEDDTYTTEYFDVLIDITENHVIKYDERITVDFLEPHHGIYRYIPIQKKFYDISDIDVDGGECKSEYEYTGEK